MNLKAYLRQGVDFFLPARCLSCTHIITSHNSLCASCWQGVEFIANNQCACCGIPFEFEVEKNILCLSCLREKPAFDRARAAIRYEAQGRELILRFKHTDLTHAAPLFAQWMMQAGSEFLKSIDLLLPVPLHWKRLFGRQYNQAALLTHSLASLTGLPFHTTLLKRHSATASQAHLKLLARKKNVQGAFTVPKKFQNHLFNKHILLVDDVLTTGATVNECASTLKNYGAKTVDVLCVARVV